MAGFFFLATLFTALIGAFLIKKIIAGLTNPLSPVPGPWHTRFTGIAVAINRIRGSTAVWTHSMHQKYGPIVRVEPDRVSISDTSLWEEIHRMGSGFRKTDFHEKLRVGPDHMLFTIVDVRQHAARRRLFARALTMDTLRRNWESQIRAKVELCVAQIRGEAESGFADVCQWWRLMAGDVIALLSFGESFDLLENGRGSKNEYFVALENAGVNLILSQVFPFLPLVAKLLPFKKLRDIMDANRVVTEKGSIAVRNLRSAHLDKANLFSNMLAEVDKAQDVVDRDADVSCLSDDAVRSEAAGFLIAGSDTTAMSLTYMIWAILNKPDLQRRLEEEVAQLDPAFTDKDIEALPLLKQTMDEALRIYNPGSGPLLRRTPAEGVTWHGHFIPGGLNVSTQSWTMVRDESVFPDPER